MRGGGALCSTRWLLLREHVARGIWKKCHGHTAGRPELKRERKVQGGGTEFPKKLDSSSAAYCMTLAGLVLRVAKSTEESTVL